MSHFIGEIIGLVIVQEMVEGEWETDSFHETPEAARSRADVLPGRTREYLITARIIDERCVSGADRESD